MKDFNYNNNKKNATYKPFAISSQMLQNKNHNSRVTNEFTSKKADAALEPINALR